MKQEMNSYPTLISDLKIEQSFESENQVNSNLVI